MGKDGSTWKHGYIPENAAAAALKAHKKPGGKGSAKRKGAPKVVNPGGRNMQDLSVPKDIQRVGKSKPKKRAGTLSSSAIRRGKG